jgi:hypothetical protein
MDRNFDIEDFEQLLKERSDEFKMYPTKRVWYSIYNNIHPGKKWPSVAMSVTLIAILLLVGYLNTDNKGIHMATTHSIQTAKAVAEDVSSSFSNPFLEKNAIYSQNTEKISGTNATLLNSNTLYNKISEENNLSFDFISRNNREEANSPTNVFDNVVPPSLPAKHNLVVVEPVTINKRTAITSIDMDFSFTVIVNENSQSAKDEKNNFPTDISGDIQTEKNIQPTQSYPVNAVVVLAALTEFECKKNNIFNAPNTSSIYNHEDVALEEVNIIPNEDKAWVENYALYNRPAPKKWAGKLRSQFYITPSVIYRQLKNTVTTDQDINNEITQYPGLGLELGAGIMYPLSDWLKVKTGLQLNFTRYNANGFGNTHPSATSITLNTSTGHHYQVLRSTPYSNYEGITPLRLHNETFQISLPVGMDIKLVGAEKLQWNIGATIQPTYVFAGKSYLISSDKKNYVKETGMLNRWNVNAGFETYISYKTNNGVTLQFGPQFRMQLYTTNKIEYSIQEKLTNYGFKFGISKLIK